MEWYNLKQENLPLEQGDIIKDTKVIVSSYELLKGQTNEANVATHDVIILSQSCDLQHVGKTNWVMVARLLDVHELFPVLSNSAKSKINTIIKGYVPNYHMIECCKIQGHEFDQKIIDFREVFSVPIQYMRELASEKIDGIVTLNSPYKEHLSQAYARFFMRVGLPTNISLY